MIPDFSTKASDRVLQLAKIFGESRQTIALAESCTGGLASACISAQAGVSNFFLGGVVSYAREVKKNILGVDSALLETLGEVHVDVAIAMARGAREKLKSDWAIGITGIAGPGGGSAEKPVGLVCFGIAGPQFEKGFEQHFSHGLRQDIQQQSVLFAFDFLLNEFRRS